ncbi:hypothetical protein WJX74_010135 [Apatococcus lobatus]|uniref:AP2/ERF domain-containing protein n=1 Tax=Apatococcus lobatus TaxID=904363 RepID=A0AAW1RK80_9CHLO
MDKVSPPETAHGQAVMGSKQAAPGPDAGKADGQTWVVTPEGHEHAQAGWPASAATAAQPESSHDRPISLCQTPPQDPKAAVPDRRSLQKDLAQPKAGHGLPDQGSTKRQWPAVQADQQSGNQGTSRPRSHRPLHPEFSRGSEAVQPQLKRAQHSCSLSFGAPQPWQNSPAFHSWDTHPNREGVTFIDSASSSGGSGAEVASPLKQLPKEELKLAMNPNALLSPAGLLGPGHKSKLTPGRRRAEQQGAAGPAVKWVLRPNNPNHQGDEQPPETHGRDQPALSDLPMAGMHCDSLAAELGLPPGTEVVRSERTGEPLISMSAALQWMQQLGPHLPLQQLPAPVSARWCPPDPDTIATRAVDRWTGGGSGGRIVRERAPKRETRDTDKRTSKYRGVSWNSAGSKWVAVLWDRSLKRARHIGTFDSELDAARAYDQAACQLIGPSARLNFRDQRGDASSDDGPGGSTIASELSLGGGIGRARPSRTHSTGTRVKSAPATPLTALLHAVARDGPGQGPDQKLARVGSFPGAGKRCLESADMEHGPQQKRSRTMLLPEMIHDSQHMSYRPSASGRQLVSPFAPRGIQRAEGAQLGAPEEGGEPRRRAATVGSRLSSAQAPSRAHPRDHGSDEEFLPFENQRKSGSLRSGSHARKLVLSSSAPPLEGVTSTAPTSGTSAYKGVSLNRGSNRWEARIRIRGRTGARNVYLGSFVDEIAAARAFDAAVLTLHGDSHPMNFSPDEYTEADMLSIRPKIDKIIQQHAIAQAPSAYKGPEQIHELSSGSGERADSGSQMQADVSQQSAPASRNSFRTRPGRKRPMQSRQDAEPVISDVPGELGGPGVPKESEEEGELEPENQENRPSKDSQTQWWPGPGKRSSKFKGVSWSESSMRWRAQYWNGSKVQYIGYFDTEEAAAVAYDKEIVKQRGPKAQTNFGQPYHADDEKTVGAPASHVLGGDAHHGDLVSPGKQASLERASSAPSRPPRPPQRSGSQNDSATNKGVSWSTRSGKWRVQMWHENKVHHLGFFDTEQQAAQAHQAATMQLHGEQLLMQSGPDAENVPQQSSAPLRPSHAHAAEAAPARRPNRTIITPAVKTSEAAPVNASTELGKQSAAPLTRQSSQALLKENLEGPQTADGHGPSPSESELADARSVDDNDSSASGWGRKRPRGFRP